MKNLKSTKLIALLLSVLMLTSVFTVCVSAADETDAPKTTAGEDKQSVITQSIEDVKEILNAKSYADYLASFEGVKAATKTITVKSTDYDKTDATTAKVKVDTYGGKQGLYVPDIGIVQWTIEVPEDAMYAIDLEYYSDSNQQNNIERCFRIDDIIPFKEARSLTMTKTWEQDLTGGEETETGFRQDNIGNDVRPSLKILPKWSTYSFRDATGYNNYPFVFYLTKGTHTISLESKREPVVLGDITLKPQEAVRTYEEVKAEYESKGYKAVSSEAAIKIQAEKSSAASSQTLYPTYDRSSAISEPQHAAKIRLNTIGKSTTWLSVGQWVEWTFTATETGLYYIVPRFKQAESPDMFVSRRLTINGEVPFDECNRLRFNYNDMFQTKPLNDGKTEFQFYFEAGKEYTLRFEVVLGDMSDMIADMQKTIDNLNKVYRKIKQITGATADTYRDYNFTGLIPNELDTLVVEAKNLTDMSAELEALTGTRGSTCATLNNIARYAKMMGLDEDEIAKNLETFKSYIGTLGTWINTARQQPLEVDYIQIQSVDQKLPKSNANFFQSAGFELRQFVASFYMDYNSLGSDAAEGDESVTVWVSTGRDQSQIIRQMINDMFTPNTGISVELKLVSAGTLLPSVLAGNGPDVSDSANPIDYAIRHAVMRVNDFDTYEDVFSRFVPELYVPFTLYGDTYGVPITMDFSMMFYRQDIFAELNLDVPQTWEEMTQILPVLQSQYMEMGIPSSLAGFTLFLYQRGGDIYTDKGMRINLDANLALDTFKDICDMFTQYRFPLTYDFANRFRNGELPLGVASYSTYTLLNAFAPELKGLWTMTTLPGMEVKDEKGNTYINNTTNVGTTALCILAGAKNPEGGWKYIDWFTSEDAQSRYGTEYMALLGNGTIYTPSNVDAMQNMGWSASELETLLAQMKNLKVEPNYPGSYIITRYVDFAFMAGYNNTGDPVETLLYNTTFINREITRKRKEFGLPTLELGQTYDDLDPETKAAVDELNDSRTIEGANKPKK